MSKFKIHHQDGQARVGRFKTAHGVIETPCFIPVGTQATVKALSPQDLKEIGVQAVLSNTYHLMLRPGEKLIKNLGGLHKFMGWDGPIMTDSGGFQVFSLGVALEHGVGKLLKESEQVEGNRQQEKVRLNKITDEGVVFQSHLDGSKHILTPEKSIQIQFALGADLIVVFDDLESPKFTYSQTQQSLELTEKWELRSLKEYKRKGVNLVHLKGGLGRTPFLYGVTHGGVFKDLRVRSAKFVDQYFEGIALGGAHKDRETLYQVVEWTVDNISLEKPRHLLGIGEVQDLWECIDRGIDLFDCAAPTRRARNGSLYISPKSKVYKNLDQYFQNNFSVNIRQARFADDAKPIDPLCYCYTCQNFSRAYLRHLYLAHELLYNRLAPYHNLYFITNLVSEIRSSIKENRLKLFKKKWFSI